MTAIPTAQLDLMLRAVDLYRGGASLAMVGREIGADVKTVSKWMNRLGVPRRTRREAARLMVATGRTGRNANPRAREMAQARWRVPGSCERCGLLLADSANLNADCVCDECDRELRAGRLYGCGELTEERRRELGYGGG